MECEGEKLSGKGTDIEKNHEVRKQKNREELTGDK